MVKNKLLLLASLFVGVSLCDSKLDDSEPELSMVQKAKNLCKSGLQSPLVPIAIAGFGAQMIEVNQYVPKKLFLNKFFAVGSSFVLSQRVPGLKKNNLIEAACAVTAVLSVVLSAR